MEAVTDAIKAVPTLDPVLFGVAALLAWLLRFGRAAFVAVDERHTFAAGLSFGVVGALLALTQEPRPWQTVALQAIALGVAVLIGERVLRAAADLTNGKIPGLPMDNQHVKCTPNPTEGDTP